MDMQETFLGLIQEEQGEAYEKGKRAGEREGYLHAQSELAALFGLLQTVGTKLLDDKKNLLEALKPEIVEMALTIAEKIVKSELLLPEKMVQHIESMLSTIALKVAGDGVHIYLCPEDLLLLDTHLQKIAYDKKDIKSIRFFSDNFIPKGDVRIESKQAFFHFSVARELEDLRSRVLKSEIAI